MRCGLVRQYLQDLDLSSILPRDEYVEFHAHTNAVIGPHGDLYKVSPFFRNVKNRSGHVRDYGQDGEIGEKLARSARGV